MIQGDKFMVRHIITIVLACVFALMALSTHPNSAVARSFSIQASDTVAVDDDRVGQLFYVNPVELPEGMTFPEVALCSASHVGNNQWITAAHCIINDYQFTGFIKQSDGDKANVTEVWISPGGEDIALLRVDSTISEKSFLISGSPADKGKTLTVLGYADERSYASAAEVKVQNFLPQVVIGESTFPKVYQTTSLRTSRSCSGDSGGPVFSGRELYAVHSAGEKNPECGDKHSSLMWHSDVTSLKELIEQQIDNSDTAMHTNMHSSSVLKNQSS